MLVPGRLDAAHIAQLGWEWKPEGLCQDDRCVPIPAAEVADGTIAISDVANRLGMPVVHDEANDVWAIGPEAGQAPLRSNRLPDLTLADFDGNPFQLSSLRGRKSLLVAWASW